MSAPKVFLKFSLGFLSLFIIICSFLFDSGEDDFSPSYESRENIYKGTQFTKLIGYIRNIQALLIVVVIIIAFSLIFLKD